MFQHTLATLRDLFDTYRDQQGNYGVVLDITSTFMAIVERGTKTTMRLQTLPSMLTCRAPVSVNLGCSQPSAI